MANACSETRMQATGHEVVECLRNHQCSVCFWQPRTGTVHKRLCLIMHLRRRNDSRHAVWKAAEYRQHSPIGHAKPREDFVNVKDLQKLIHQQYGDRLILSVKYPVSAEG